MKACYFILFFPFVFALTAERLNAQQFTNAAEALGIVHTMNSTDGFGGGVSFCDFDQDGWDDITLVNENDSLYFFRNMGGDYERVYYAGIFSGTVRQALWVDYDNDGHLDLFVSRDGSSCLLFRNNGDMTFQDVTSAAGLAGFNTRNYGVSFADYNKDGFLDFYLARLVMVGDPTNEQNVNALFKNNGDGTFTNVAFEAGVANGTKLSFMGGWMDYNNDGWPDLMVINDKIDDHNHLYHNNGDGTFTDVTDNTGAHMHLTDAMSATFADFDNDGDLDFYSTSTHHLTTHPKLLVNHNGAYFTEEADARGVNFNQWSWGATFLDANNDSNLDLYIASGWTSGHWNPEESSALFMNNGDHTFTNQTEYLFEQTTKAASYGVAIGDVNNDGYPEIVSLNAKNYDSFLWMNAGGDKHYVKVTLQGIVSNSMAIGSWINVYAAGQKFVHYTRCGENYCSQNSQHHIFGLGSSEMVDSILVSYPSGHTDKYYYLPASQHYYFTEGETYDVAINHDDVFSICTGDSVSLSTNEHSSYLWNTGDTTQSITVSQGGAYFVEVWNAFGLSAYSDTVVVTVVPEAEVQFNLQHVSCASAMDGSITVQISTGPVQEITWNTGATDTLIQQLGGGIYSFTALDSAGCVVSGEVSLSEPPPLAAQAVTTNALCYGDANGTAQIEVIGGSPPFTVDWNNANPAALPVGNYNVVITDAQGCDKELNFDIHQPDSLWAELDVNPAGSSSSGSVIVEVFGGTPPYDILWSTGATGANALDSLPSGEYNIWITDAQDCSWSADFLVDQSSGIAARDAESVRVFPNPATDQLHISGCQEVWNFALYNLTGELVLPQLAGNCPMRLDLSPLSAGTYILQMTSSGQHVVRRVVVGR